MELILLIIAFIATFLGSLIGLGGGIILKPILDLYHMDVLTIGVLSSITVLSVALVSSIKHIYARRINNTTLLLGAGAFFGGILGNIMLRYYSMDPVFLREIQSLAMIYMLVLVFIVTMLKFKLKPLNIDSIYITLFVGFMLGSVTSFLGIGGGALNLFLLYWLYGYDRKQLAASSVMIIISAHILKLAFIPLTFELDFLFYLIPGAIVGGYIGAVANRRITVKTMTIIFSVVVFLLLGLNLYNYGLF